MMTLPSSSTDQWVKSALRNDTLVVELLLDLKHASDSDSFKPTTITIPSKDVTTPLRTTLLPPPGWSNRKIRSKSSKNKEHRGSPTTHLSWSCSGSDGVSDLSYGARSIKANEGASTSSYNNKSLKRKTFVDLKDEEGSLFKGRIHVNKELTSKRMTLNQQSATTNENVKRIKVDPDQKLINKIGRMGEQERQTKVPPSLANQSVKISIRVEAKTEAPQRGFVLPDLNMIPNEEDLMAVS